MPATWKQIDATDPGAIAVEREPFAVGVKPSTVSQRPQLAASIVTSSGPVPRLRHTTDENAGTSTRGAGRIAASVTVTVVVTRWPCPGADSSGADAQPATTAAAASKVGTGRERRVGGGDAIAGRRIRAAAHRRHRIGNDGGPTRWITPWSAFVDCDGALRGYSPHLALSSSENLMPSLRCLPPLLALALLAGCDSKVSSAIDTDLQQRVETLEDCFPNLYRRVQALLDLTDTWRQLNGQPIPDPVGLTWQVDAEAGGTVVDVTYVVDGTTIAMAIRFYSPTGAQQTLTTLTGQTTLDATIDAAATELRDVFGAADKFMVGDYTISGGGITGSDSLTAIIGGSTNQNELEELRTTAASSTIAGGPPDVDPATITDAGPPVCSLTFTIPGLLTDETPTQEYPIGTVTLSIAGPEATVGATITFDGSAVAVIDVDDVPGTFTFDVETRTLTFVP